jgi:hypothetical protein
VIYNPEGRLIAKERKPNQIANQKNTQNNENFIIKVGKNIFKIGIGFITDSNDKNISFLCSNSK